jgi:hypothetical protein
MHSQGLTPSPIDILNLYWSGDINANNNAFKDRLNKIFTWDALTENGYISEIAPFTCSILEKIDTKHEIISNILKKRLKSIYYNSMVPNMLLHNELANVVEAFREAEVRVIVLKGTALAEMVYGNIALRHAGDIDLLIPIKDLEKAKALLSILDFKKIEHFSLSNLWEKCPFHFQFAKEGNLNNIIIELHWDLAKKPFTLDIADILQRAVTVKVNGINIPVMCPDDLLPYLCWHAANHLFPRLLWLCDIAQVIKIYDKRINWHNVIERSETWKIRKAVYYSLYLAKNVLGAQVPERVLLRLRPSNFENKIFKFVMLNMDYEGGIIQTSNRFLIIALRLLIIDRLKDRVFFFFKYIRDLVFPGIPYIKVRYSISKSSLAKLYQFLHPFILMYESILWSLEIVKFGLGRYRKISGKRTKKGTVLISL